MLVASKCDHDPKCAEGKCSNMKGTASAKGFPKKSLKQTMLKK